MCEGGRVGFTENVKDKQGSEESAKLARRRRAAWEVERAGKEALGEGARPKEGEAAER